ncbi:MAG: LptF/LptG family permease [Flavobacteriales bacterium]|nr:LptF/LptG family permease [Flavobacteriales bacterium]
MLKKLDIYIIKKFLTTFFFTIILIICVIIVFDLSEKLEDFIKNEAPLKAIVFDYYLNLVPYFANMLSPLFVFISVIFFTSKMASNSEIVAILAGGIKFSRLLRPFLICAFFLAGLSYYLNNFLIPNANKNRLAFEEVYYRNKLRNYAQDIHMKINDNTYIYMTNFVIDMNMGNNFSIERFNEDGELEYKLLSDNVKWDTTINKWSITNYVERHIDGLNETIKRGVRKDTILDLKVGEFKRRVNYVTTMDYFELNDFIKEQKFKGSQQVVLYELEKYQRGAYPFATFILTLIAVAISSRKVRGGIGLHIGLGLLISFSYILFMKVSSTFAISAGLPAIIAIWIPNFLYSILAVILLKKAPK